MFRWYALIVLTAWMLAASAVEPARQQVLCLHSYHPAEWTDAIMRGYRGILGGRGNLDLAVEYMDTKRCEDAAYLDLLAEAYRRKYAGTRFAGILTSDDHAYAFALKWRAQLFADAPVVFCGVNRRYREVWWLYPSENSAECDRYVIFNMADNSWAYGTFDRTMIIGDSDVFSDTYGFSPDGYIYTHELGTSADGANLNAYIESGAVEIDDAGVAMLHVSKFIPDLREFTGSVELTLTAKKYPQATETQVSGPHTIVPSTEFVNPRVCGRQMILRFESNSTDSTWRLGMPRIDANPHGRR